MIRIFFSLAFLLASGGFSHAETLPSEAFLEHAPFTVDEVKDAAAVVATVSIVVSGTTFLLTSDKGLAPTMYTTLVSTGLTLLYNGQIRGLGNFPAQFSRYINWVGSLSESRLAGLPGIGREAFGRARRETGRLGAVIGPAMLGTALFVLAANSGDVRITFGSLSALGFILTQTASGLSTNAPWDLFEAEVRMQPGDMDNNERLARLSLYVRQIVGAAVAPFFFFPNAQFATAAIFLTHGLLGVGAVIYRERATHILAQSMQMLESSKWVRLGTRTYSRVLSAIKNVSCEMLLF